MISGGLTLLATGAIGAVGGIGAGGGAAVVVGAGAAAGTLGLGGVVTGLLPLVAAGALGVLGEKLHFNGSQLTWLLSGVSSAMCIGPAYCTTANGQCCTLILDSDRGIVICPLSC